MLFDVGLLVLRARCLGQPGAGRDVSPLSLFRCVHVGRLVQAAALRCVALRCVGWCSAQMPFPVCVFLGVRTCVCSQGIGDRCIGLFVVVPVLRWPAYMLRTPAPCTCAVIVMKFSSVTLSCTATGSILNSSSHASVSYCGVMQCNVYLYVCWSRPDTRKQPASHRTDQTRPR
jgi:hypothetical protein